MNGILDLLKSEKGIAIGALILGATVLVALGKMSVGDWQSYTATLAITYVGGKTVQGAVASVVNRNKPGQANPTNVDPAPPVTP